MLVKSCVYMVSALAYGPIPFIYSSRWLCRLASPRLHVVLELLTGPRNTDTPCEFVQQTRQAQCCHFILFLKYGTLFSQFYFFLLYSYFFFTKYFFYTFFRTNFMKFWLLFSYIEGGVLSILTAFLSVWLMSFDGFEKLFQAEETIIHVHLLQREMVELIWKTSDQIHKTWGTERQRCR